MRRRLAIAAAILAMSLPADASAAMPVDCGNRVYDKEATFSFTLTRLRAGERAGVRYVQYQLHMQAYLATKANVDYTTLQATGRAPAADRQPGTTTRD